MTLATILAVLPGASVCRATGLEKLLMPGPLARAHADLEENCSACHDRTDRTRQRALCLDCHKEVAQDVARRAGFHGRLDNASGECKACHSEHLGREADIVKLVPAAFDHAATDFRLENAHANAPCESCHVAGRKFREANTSCGACHRADDVHRGGLGTDCGSCHVTLAWRNPTFDHAKTGFPLLGGHASTACGACHPGGRYRDTPKRCIGCHAPDDVHRGSRGENCADCHVPSAWSTARFDHARETGFALVGTHAALDCAGCHRSARFDDKPPRTCVGCHRADDAHAGRFGENCATCHGNEKWREVTFDHARDAKFDLTGRHARVDCHACHTAPLAVQKLPTDCASCHRGADVHGGAQRVACDSCHGTDGWREDLRFDHDLSSFPLLGMHVMVGCGQCHATRAYAGTPHECVACHRSSDVHQGSLGTRCDSCHSPNGWKVWDFDHNQQTKFALTGRHARLECGACHRAGAASMRLPTDCASCHRDNDVHLGQFGAQCQRCHNTITFKGARIQ